MENSLSVIRIICIILGLVVSGCTRLKPATPLAAERAVLEALPKSWTSQQKPSQDWVTELVLIGPNPHYFLWADRAGMRHEESVATESVHVMIHTNEIFTLFQKIKCGAPRFCMRNGAFSFMRRSHITSPTKYGGHQF